MGWVFSRRVGLAGVSCVALVGSLGVSPGVFGAERGYYDVIDQSVISAVSASSDRPGQDLPKTLDGKISTFWHSNWDGKGTGSASTPHTLVYAVNSAEAGEVSGVRLGTRQSSSGSGRVKDVDIYVKSGGTCEAGAADWPTTPTVSASYEAADKGDHDVTFDARPVSCVKVVYRSAWDGSSNESVHSSLAEFNLLKFVEGERPVPAPPAGTAYDPRPLPAGVVSSSAVLDPLALDDRRADNPDRSPIALVMSRPGEPARVVGARVSTNPGVVDMSTVTGRAYYVDCQADPAGSDGTREHPFTSVAQVNEHGAFEPGDAILFKRGTVCRGLLTPQGSGRAGESITIDAYGDASAARPVIHGMGANESADNRIPRSLQSQTGKGIESAVIRLFNQEYWTIRNMELTNYAGDSTDWHERRRGIVIALEDYGRGHGYEISDVYIHDVLGLPDKDLGGSGGIQFEAYAGAKKVPTSFEGIEVHHNTIKHVSRSGINEGSNFRSRASVGGSIRDNPFEVWAPMDVHDNIVSDIAGDAIVTQFASHSQVYNNTVWDSANHHGGRASAGNNAAVWAWDADYVTYRNNHVFDTKMPNGTWDGTAFDADYGTTGTLFENNVTHDNVGGFMLFCGCGGLSTQTTMRYNLSINDGRGGENHNQGPRVFFVAGQTDAQVYNNTFLVYPNAKVDKGSSKNSGIAYQNNVFMAQGPVGTTVSDQVASSSPFTHNVYAGTAGSWPFPDRNTVLADVHPVGSQGLDAVRLADEHVTGKGVRTARLTLTDRYNATTTLTDVTGQAIDTAAIRPDVGALQVSPVTSSDVEATRVADGGFEHADGGSWSVSDGAMVQAGAGRENGHGLVLGAQGRAVQEVPVGVNTTYRLEAVVKAASDGTRPTISVSTPAGLAVQAVPAGGPDAGGWVPVSGVIRTAWDASTVTVTVAGAGVVDDLALVPVADYVVDGSFESQGNSPWSNNARSTDAVSGGLALNISSTAENAQVVVPDVDVDYELAGWTKTTGGARVTLGAKNLGAGRDQVTTNNSSATYTHHGVTVRPAQKQFTVYCYLPNGGQATCDDITVTRAWDAAVTHIPSTQDTTTPTAPTIADNVVTIPDTEGVEYVVDGEVVTGTITLTAENTPVIVTARAKDGYALAEGATAKWTFEYTAPVTPPAPTEPPTEPVEPVVPPVSDGGNVYLRGSVSTGVADTAFQYGWSGDEIFFGDWDGDGIKTVGLRRGNTFYLKNTNTGGSADIAFTYGRAGDQLVVGDWNGDGIDTIGVYRNQTFHLSNTLTNTVADLTFVYGRNGDVPVAGDWNGDGTDTVGVQRGRLYYLSDTNAAGHADHTFAFGRPGDTPVVGDADGNGTDTVSVRRGREFFVKNTLADGPADTVAAYGAPSDTGAIVAWLAPNTPGLAVTR